MRSVGKRVVRESGSSGKCSGCVWVREVTGCYLFAGAKTCEALNSKGFELYSVGKGNLQRF